ncbi:hypothetical protein [Mycobacterium sp. SMC-4]|uniref:hypothetical protein n=1 Tax=Mycobacterium sp. SMC-4 TaxID=2857059 RepID=UPI0021B1A294|nr:hypothetical protein [Mycobacterium sp. SMC-4]UXA19547.1 hypothetical protein KXD98_08095 [Mycobacterium sp. SMC-4]
MTAHQQFPGHVGDAGSTGFAAQLPPQLLAMMPANPRPRTPQESLTMLVQIIELLAQRGPDAANGLTVVQTRDERGVTIRIDLPG